MNRDNSVWWLLLALFIFVVIMNNAGCLRDSGPVIRESTVQPAVVSPEGGTKAPCANGKCRLPKKKRDTTIWT